MNASSPSRHRARKLAIRSAITFSPDAGGVSEVLLDLVRFGLGGAQGAGNQDVSWIHEFAFIRAIGPLIAREDLERELRLSNKYYASNTLKQNGEMRYFDSPGHGLGRGE